MHPRRPTTNQQEANKTDFVDELVDSFRSMNTLKPDSADTPSARSNKNTNVKPSKPSALYSSSGFLSSSSQKRRSVTITTGTESDLDYNNNETVVDDDDGNDDSNLFFRNHHHQQSGTSIAASSSSTMKTAAPPPVTGFKQPQTMKPSSATRPNIMMNHQRDNNSGGVRNLFHLVHNKTTTTTTEAIRPSTSPRGTTTMTAINNNNNNGGGNDIFNATFSSTTSYDPQKRSSRSKFNPFDARKVAVLEQYGIAGDHSLPWERIPSTAPQVTLLPHFLPLPKPPQQSQPSDPNLYRVSRVKSSNAVPQQQQQDQEESKNAEKLETVDENTLQKEQHERVVKRPDGLSSIFSSSSRSKTATKGGGENNIGGGRDQDRNDNSNHNSHHLASSAAISDRPEIIRRATSARAVEERKRRDKATNAYGVSLFGQVQDNVLRTTSHRAKVPSLVELARAIPPEALESLDTLKQMLDEDGGLLETVPAITRETCSVVLPLGAHGAEFGPQRRSGQATSDEVVHFLIGGIGFNAFKNAASRPETATNDASIAEWQAEMSTPRRGVGNNRGTSPKRHLTEDAISTLPTNSGFVKDWMFKNFMMDDGALSDSHGKRRQSVADGVDPYSSDRFRRDGLAVDPTSVERSRLMMEKIWGRHAKTKWITVAKHYAIVKKALREISQEAMPMFKLLRNKLLEKSKDIFAGTATKDLFEKLLQEKGRRQFLGDNGVSRVDEEAEWERRVSTLVHQGSMNLLEALRQQEEEERQQQQSEQGNDDDDATTASTTTQQQQQQKRKLIQKEQIKELLMQQRSSSSSATKSGEELSQLADKYQKQIEILMRIQQTIDGLGVDVTSSPTVTKTINADAVAFKAMTEFIQKEHNQKRMKKASKKIRKRISIALGGSAAEMTLMSAHSIVDLMNFTKGSSNNGSHSLLDLDSDDDDFDDEFDYFNHDSDDDDDDENASSGKRTSKNGKQNGKNKKSTSSSSPNKKNNNTRKKVSEAQKQKNRQYRRYSYFSKDELEALNNLMQEDPEKFATIVRTAKDNTDDEFASALKLMNEATGGNNNNNSQGLNNKSKFQSAASAADAINVARAILEKVYDVAEVKLAQNGITDISSLRVAPNTGTARTSTSSPTSTSTSALSQVNRRESSSSAAAVISHRSVSSQLQNHHHHHNNNNNSGTESASTSRSGSPSSTNNVSAPLPQQPRSSISPTATSSHHQQQHQQHVHSSSTPPPQSSRRDFSSFVPIRNRLVFGGVRNTIPHSHRVDVSCEELGLDFVKHIRPLIAKLNLLDMGFKKAIQQVNVIAKAASEIPASAFFVPPSSFPSNNQNNNSQLLVGGQNHFGSGAFNSNSRNSFRRASSASSSSSFRQNNNNNNNSLSGPSMMKMTSSSMSGEQIEQKLNQNFSSMAVTTTTGGEKSPLMPIPLRSNSSAGNAHRQFPPVAIGSGNNNNNPGGVLKNTALQAFAASAFIQASQDGKALKEGQLFRFKSNDPNVSASGNYYCDMWFTCERAAQALRKTTEKIRDASLMLKMRRRRTQAMIEVKNEVERSFVQAAHEREKKIHIQQQQQQHQSTFSVFNNNNNNNNNNNTSSSAAAASTGGITSSCSSSSYASTYEERQCILDRVPFEVRVKLFGEEASLLRDARRGALFSQKKSDRTAMILNQLEQPVYGDGSGDRRLALAKRIMENEKAKLVAASTSSTSTVAMSRSRKDPFLQERSSLVIQNKNIKKPIPTSTTSQSEQNPKSAIGYALGIIDETRLWKEVDDAEERLANPEKYNNNNISVLEATLKSGGNNKDLGSSMNGSETPLSNTSFGGTVPSLNNTANFLLLSAGDNNQNNRNKNNRSGFNNNLNRRSRRGRNHHHHQATHQSRRSPSNGNTSSIIGVFNSQIDVFNQSSSKLGFSGSTHPVTNRNNNNIQNNNGNRSPSHDSDRSSLDNTLSGTVTSIVDVGLVYSNNLRDVAIQNCIEDERTVRCFELLDQLRSEETASMTTIQRVCNTAANLSLLVSSLETDLSCPRCLQVLRQPQIVAPCGTTVCRSCVLSTDDQRHDEIDAGFSYRARQDCGCQVHEGTAVNRGLDTMLNLWPDMKQTSARLTAALNEITSALNREGVTEDNVTSENLKKVKGKAEKSMMNMSMSEVESFAHQYNPFAQSHHNHQSHHHNSVSVHRMTRGDSFHQQQQQSNLSQSSSPAGSFSGAPHHKKRRSVSPGNVVM